MVTGLSVCHKRTVGQLIEQVSGGLIEVKPSRYDLVHLLGVQAFMQLGRAVAQYTHSHQFG